MKRSVHACTGRVREGGIVVWMAAYYASPLHTSLSLFSHAAELLLCSPLIIIVAEELPQRNTL